MRRLLRLIGPLTGYMLLAIALGALGHACAIFIPVLGGVALLRAAAAPAALPGLFAAVLILAAGRGACRYGEQLCNHYIAFKLLAVLRDRVFTALRRLCPAKLETRGRGDLIALLTGDIELLEVFYAHTVSPVAIAALVSLGAALFAGSFHPLLGLIAAAGYLTVGALLPALTARASRAEAGALRGRAGAFSSFYLDSLRGLADLMQLGQGRPRRAEMGRLTEEMEAVQGALRRREGRTGALSGLAVTVFSLCTLAAARLLGPTAGVDDAGALLATLAVFSSFGPVLALSNLSGSLPGTLAAGQRVLDLLDETPETPDVPAGPTPPFTGAESRALSFSYGAHEVLRGLSVRIPQGRITGVVGRSGSGKSTFLKLLMRFWRAPAGALFLSDVELDRIPTAHLRALEGYVTQETDLFHDTIEANIKLGRPDAARAEVTAAARKASVHDFIVSLPEGYDTQVGELGGTLSGGERQRIGLARAFLHGAPLLLLDEPTSSLDSLNEGIILRALREESAGRAVVLVSHRRSTMGVADTIYTVDGGRTIDN
ncbi:MAG: ABC transporter ATP-binding protein/permease [Oscillospiraceae bacterium]|nr:ABC transporter ATP-binding protein/permease [Oscillospiraceae bacterium]